MQRQLVRELMDQGSPDPDRLAESLNDLAWYNRSLGATATVIHQVERLLGGVIPSRLRILDVGCGGGDMLAALGRWSEGRDVELEGVGLELGRETIRIAKRRLEGGDRGARVRLVRGDARSLPFGERAFDVAICSTFLHHLETEDAVEALREMSRVSELGVVVSDLRRGTAGYLASLCLALTVWGRHRYTRHDAPASLRAAFTLKEARGLAERVGLDAVVEPQPLFRWGLRWKRP
jgi:SAM-dependent methyltransferase